MNQSIQCFYFSKYSIGARPIFYLALILLFILHIPLAYLSLGRDQGIWSTAGLALLDGRIYWKDFVHFHFPGLAIAFSGAFQLTDDPRVAAMWVNLFGSIIAVIGIFSLVEKTYNKSAASWASLFFVVFSTTMMDTQLIAQKDTMAIAGIFLASALMAKAQSSHYKNGYIYSAGVVVIISTLFKPLFAIAGIIFALFQVFQHVNNKNSKNIQYKVLIIELCFLLAGALSVIGLGIAYLVYHAALQDMLISTFYIAREYTYISPIEFSKLLKIATIAVFVPGIGNPVLWLIIVSCGIGKTIKLIKSDKIWLLAPLLTSLFSFFIQRKGFPYQVAPLVECMFIFAGIGVSTILVYLPHKQSVKRRVLRILFLLLLCLMPIISIIQFSYGKHLIPYYLGFIDRTTYLARTPLISHHLHPSKQEEVAMWINNNTQPSDLILVWGLECQFYSLSGRLYASHSPFDFILTSPRFDQLNLEWLKNKKNQFISDLKRQKPKLIIVALNDKNSNEFITSLESMKQFSEFHALIKERYQLIKTSDHFNFYQLKK